MTIDDHNESLPTGETVLEKAQVDENYLVEPEQAMPQASVTDLPEPLQKAVAAAGWTELMPVQSRAIPYLVAGRDLMVQSRTGSGKTGAFLIPILERVNPRQPVCQALVLVPTRELAQQVAREAEVMGPTTGMKTVAVYGGTRFGTQTEAIRQGAHLVVGTPGRVLDHLMRGTLRLDNLKLLIFDEADRMLDMGFYPDMRQVQSYLPQRHVNTCMSSATFPPFVMRLAKEFMHEPDFLSLSRDNVHVADVNHVTYTVPTMEKDRALVRLIEMENPASAFIFCNTKAKVHYVSVVLQRFGYDADELSADLAQADRDKVMARVRQGTLRFLVTTDVAARGIDIDDLSHVFLYEPPEDVESYIHRAGRTGRAGASGTAITLVGDISELLRMQKVAKQYHIALDERPLPTDEDVAELVGQRLQVLLKAKLRGRDKLQTERMARFMPLARQLAEDEDGLPLLAMLLDDENQQALHAPVIPPPPPPTRLPQERPEGERKRGRSRGRRR
jgi:ATP-dependent RNA helicase DeaD